MSALRKLERLPDPHVVEYLKGALDRAIAGEITGVLIVSEGGGEIRYSVAGLKDRLVVSGWLFHALYKLQSDGPST